MIHLKTVTVQPTFSDQSKAYPFSLPLVQQLDRLTFEKPVTFFVGENGSGKSTLLESLACAIGSITVGSESVSTDKTLAAVRRLAKQYRLRWDHKTKRGFFLRAEDFFGYAKRLAEMRAEMEEALRRIDQEYDAENRSDFAKGLAKMPYANELGDMKRRFGEEGLDANSHGEGFMALFQDRFVPDGLYLLDEPEAALSPLRQIAFLATLREMVGLNGQFIIATHSPIILAFPDADIWQFEDGRIEQVDYESLEHVRLTREFLADPAAYFRYLWE